MKTRSRATLAPCVRALSRLLPLALLLALLPACQPIPYDAHIQAMRVALTDLYDPEPSQFLYATLPDAALEQMRDTKQREGDAVIYTVDAALPDIASLSPADVAFDLPPPAVDWNDITTDDVDAARSEFEAGYCAALLELLRGGTVAATDATVALTVAVTPSGEGYAADVRNAEDICDALYAPLAELRRAALIESDAYGLFAAAALAPEQYPADFLALPIAAHTRITDVRRTQGTRYEVTIAYPTIRDICAKAGDDLYATYEAAIFTPLPDALDPAFDERIEAHAAASQAKTHSTFELDIAQIVAQSGYLPTAAVASSTDPSFEAIVSSISDALARGKSEVAQRINGDFYVTPGHAADLTESSFAERFAAKPSSYAPTLPTDGVVTVVRKDDAKKEWKNDQIDALLALADPDLIATDDARFASVILYYTVKTPSAGKYKTSSYTFTAYNCELTLSAYDLRAKKNIGSATFGTYYGNTITFSESSIVKSSSGARSLTAGIPTIDLKEGSKSAKKAQEFIDKVAKAARKGET